MSNFISISHCVTECSNDAHIHHWQRFYVGRHSENSFNSLTVNQFLVQSRCLRSNLIGLVVQPVYTAIELTSGHFLLDHAANTLSFLACGVSLCTMTAISVDRFSVLQYHMRYPDLMTTNVPCIQLRPFG